MPIFISYNHQDKGFVTALARNLVYARHNVWIDTWELNAGDSLLDRIQEAIGESDAILVILSEHSINSEWCKRELNAGMMRELEERRAILIPCILGDCEVPLFLRDKLYVDFRNDKDQAFELLDRSLKRVSNPQQSRIDRQEFHTDWSVDWGTVQDSSVIEWLFVDHSEKVSYCVVTRFRLILDSQEAERLFQEHLSDGSHLVYACGFLSNFLSNVKNDDFRVTIPDATEISETHRLVGNTGEEAILRFGIRRLGIDNGMDTIFTVDEVLNRAIRHTLSASRLPNND